MFDYIYRSDLLVAQTVVVPKLLFSSQRFQALSPMAKILYAMLSEACVNGSCQFDRFLLTDICMDLCCTADEMETWLEELSEYHLVTLNATSLCVHEIQ